MTYIVLDAGHGGAQDLGKSTAYGARGRSGALEKDLTLDLVRRISDNLEPGVLRTRHDDHNLSLAGRAAALGGRGGVFVSIHADSGSRPGTWVHAQGGASSRALAACIEDALSARYGRRNQPQEAPLAVLDPAALGEGAAGCLVEVGDLRDPEVERRLADPFERATLGLAIASGIRAYAGRARLGDGEQSFDVRYSDVQLVPQSTGWSCWAASTAMVAGWNRQQSIPPQEIARTIGYWNQYAKTGLDAEDQRVFDAWDMAYEAPQSYSVEGFRRLLEAWGPVWVAAKVGGPHVRVVYGLSGDGTPEGTTVYIHDPWEEGMTTFRESNRGSSYTRTYARFVQEIENLARDEAGRRAPIYMAHMKNPRLGGVAPGSYGVIGAIRPIRQPTTHSCWATTFAMMTNWRNGTALAPREAVAAVGARWATQYDLSNHPDPDQRQGLPWDDYPAFARDASLRMMAPQNMTAEGWVEHFQHVGGPIWIGHIPGGPTGGGGHAWVLEGIEFDGTNEGSTFCFVDPATGRRDRQAFLIFLQEYEERYRRSNGHPHVLYW